MTITVTQDDIDIGVGGNCRLCPVTLAATRAFGFNVWTGLVGVHGRGKIFLLPMDAEQFIRDFDGGRPVTPFSFDVKEGVTE